MAKTCHLLTWQVDKKIPGGMNSHFPSEYTWTLVGYALLNSCEAELNSNMSGVQTLLGGNLVS